MKSIFISVLVLLGLSFSFAQSQSFLVLGDTHYDKLEYHDFKWLKREKPGDIRQIEGYTANVENNWEDFMKHLQSMKNTYKPEIKALLQLGDLSEGLAGDSKADLMAKGVVEAVEVSNIGIPWIITKGNHDVTSGTPAKTAFIDNYIPLFQRQTGDKSIQMANYTYRSGDAEFFVCDYYERSRFDFINWLDEKAKASDAKVKFVLFHEPVIPVTERCWHMYKTDDVNRQRLLKTIAENNLIVFAAHLHRYSVVKRETEWGSIVQIMCSSVISDRNAVTPKNMITEYGESLAINVPGFEPATLETRKAMLRAEAPFVTFYKQCSLQGFGILTVSEPDNKVIFNYYGGLSCEAYDAMDITALLKEN